MAEQVGESVQALTVPVGKATLQAVLTLPPHAGGLVLFAHGSGSSRLSPRNRYVAAVLARAGLGTVLADLFTPEEAARDACTRALRFDIGHLAVRLIGLCDWLMAAPLTRGRRLGLFGASTGAAAALVAAAQRPQDVAAVVSRGGRPDLAGSALARVQAPTLLIVGGRDEGVIELNERALIALCSPKRLVTVPGATHLFEEPGALEAVADAAAAWFRDKLAAVRV